MMHEHTITKNKIGPFPVLKYTGRDIYDGNTWLFYN